jgi:hypothetical protein
LEKKFPGRVKSAFEMFMPDPDSPSLNVSEPGHIGKKVPGSAKSLSEMFMPDPD